MSRDSNDLGDKAVSVLATVFVLFGGVAASIFLIVTNSPTPSQTLLMFGGGCGGAAILLWLLRDRDPLTPKQAMWAWFLRERPRSVDYVPKYRPPPASSAPRQPPTADEIREIRETSENAWVPNNNPKRRHKDGA